jgi:hypothetical protein
VNDAEDGKRLADGDPAAIALWDAQAEVDVAVLILDYLTRNPPPGASEAESDFRAWALNLQRDGQSRLAALGHRHLRAV